jgi:nucleoside-diphosphate-sugar epimerase
MFGQLSGTITRRVDMVAEGKTVPVYPDGPNHQNPLYVSDGVRLAEKALLIASVPAEIMNFAGSETSTVQEYCQMAADMLGTKASFREDPKAYYPIWPDVTLMHQKLGRCEVGVRESVRLILERGRENRERTNWIPGSQ